VILLGAFAPEHVVPTLDRLATEIVEPARAL
jgi:hypothetical protein